MKRSTQSCSAVPEPSKAAQALDLYARVEDLLGVKEAAPDLYAFYFRFLERVSFETLLDIGCGSGDFLLEAKRRFPAGKVRGIDLSAAMVEVSRQKGLDVQAVDLCSVRGNFDILTAVFDMLNYLDRRALKRFLSCVEARVEEGGYFLCDINTLYGFEVISVGSYIVDEGDRFLTVDGDFGDLLYESSFTLFEKLHDSCFVKSEATIRQYYHTADEIRALLPDMTLLDEESVTLYGEKPDKHFLVFQKR
jgi:predicted TPR repeat methyltransferase